MIGNDLESTNGSINDPFKTLSFALSKVTDEEIIYLREGSYEISETEINKNIIISSYKNENVVLDGTRSIDELKDSISKDNQDQKNLNQETNRQTFVERLKDRLGQSKLFGNLKDSIGTLGTKLGSAFTRFTAPLKDFLGSTVGKIAGFGLGTIASLAAALAFVNSDMFEKMIDFLAKKLPGIIEKFIGFFGQVRDAFVETNKNIQSFLANPDMDTFKGLFSDVGPIVKALGILLLLLNSSAH